MAKSAPFPARMNYQPHIEMVPRPLWGLNMRAIMKQTHWRKLRLALLERQGAVCATCKKVETAPGRVYAHEQWEYDESSEPATAKITGISLLCWHCHACEHWGCTNVMSCDLPRAKDDTIAHFCRLNSVSKADFHAHETDALSIWGKRNRRTWQIEYGPFEEWVFKTYPFDPFNKRDWSAQMAVKWGNDGCPSMEDVVAEAERQNLGIQPPPPSREGDHGVVERASRV